MTRLTSVINESFIKRLQGLQQTGGARDKALASLKGEKISVSQTLRFGARTFASGVQRLNVAISSLNIVGNGLDSLEAITGSMLELAQKSLKENTSQSERSQLNSEYQDLGDTFLKVIERLNGGKVKFLTKEGVSDIFKQVGLDPSQADGIAELFSQFVGEGADELLVSDEIKPTKSAPSIKSSGSLSPLEIDKGVAVTTAKVTAKGARFSAIDDATFTGANVASTSIIGRSYDGSYTGLQETLLSNVSLVGSQSSTGSVFLESSQNFTGSNPSELAQVFVANDSSLVTSQLTNNASSTVSFKSVSMSDNGLKGIVREYDSSISRSSVVLYERSSETANPSTTTRTVLASNISAVDFEPAINRAGTHVVYDNGGTGAELKELSAGGVNSFLSGLANVRDVTFSGQDEVAVLHGAGTYSLSSVKATSSNFERTLASGLTNASFDSVEATPNGSLGYIGYLDNTKQFKIITNEGGAVSSIDFSAATALTDVSIALRGSSSRIVVGAVGQLGGDTSSHLYQATTTRGERKSLPEFSKLFGGESDILSRASAASVINNLGAIRDRINENREALNDAKEIIGSNLDLVRAAGFASLNLSKEITGAPEARDVANELARRIRADAPQALSQAGNLELVIVAALTGQGALSNTNKK